MCQKSHPYGIWDYGPMKLQISDYWGPLQRKVVWVFLPLGNGIHLAYLPRKKKGSTHQTFSKFELHMTMPNMCSSFYSPIKQFALLFCALQTVVLHKKPAWIHVLMSCAENKNSHAVCTWDSNSPEGKKASVYSLSTSEGKNLEGFMFWWFCAGFKNK
jgi:hypothetical protein